MADKSAHNLKTPAPAATARHVSHAPPAAQDAGGANGAGAVSITWDDLKTRKVDARLKEQDALARNRDYAKMDEASLPQGPAKASLLARLWRNSIFALALFGLVGGVLAWACGASLQFRSDVKADADSRWQAILQIGRAVDSKQITQDQADAAIAAAVAAGRAANPYFAVRTDPRYADMNLPPGEQAARSAEQQYRMKEVVQQDQLRNRIRYVLSYGAAGVMLALCLAIAVPLTERNIPAVVISGSVGAALGLVGGVVVSLLVDRVREAIAPAAAAANGAAGAAAPTDPLRQLLAQVAVWGMMGLFLSAAPGLVMRNVKKLGIGLVGGVIGGFVGGALFDTIEAATRDTRFASLGLASLAALVAIGVFAGLATGVIENAAKTGWLRVTQGLIAGKQFILYRNPTFVGSGPDCQIYLFKDPKVGRRHAAIHILPGGFELEDLPLGESTYVNGKPAQRARLKSGDRIQIGGTCLVFQEKAPAA